jgi:hypothetical protein
VLDAPRRMLTSTLDSWLTPQAESGQPQLARAIQLAQLVVHGSEHYGNLLTYMRIKGIVPPSSTHQK